MWIICKRTPDGLIEASRNPQLHNTYDKAWSVANRLAHNVPGAEFIVFMAKAGVKKEVVYKDNVKIY